MIVEREVVFAVNVLKGESRDCSSISHNHIDILVSVRSPKLSTLSLVRTRWVTICEFQALYVREHYKNLMLSFPLTAIYKQLGTACEFDISLGLPPLVEAGSAHLV